MPSNVTKTYGVMLLNVTKTYKEVLASNVTKNYGVMLSNNDTKKRII
jgi:hypothetical protein